MFPLKQSVLQGAKKTDLSYYNTKYKLSPAAIRLRLLMSWCAATGATAAKRLGRLSLSFSFCCPLGAEAALGTFEAALQGIIRAL